MGENDIKKPEEAEAAVTLEEDTDTHEEASDRNGDDPGAGSEADACGENGPDDETEDPEGGKKKKGRTGMLIGGIALGMALVIAAEGILLTVLSHGGVDYLGVFRKMALIDTYIDRYYLYDVHPDTVADGIFTGMIYGLDEDDYAVYYPETAYDELKKQESGSYVGIGVTVSKDPETEGILVAAVSPGGPAESAGILTGDILIKADGQDLKALDLDAAVDLISGEKGTSVDITLLRNGEEMNVTVERKDIVTYTVHHKVLSEDEFKSSRMNMKIGYISINQFIKTTEQDFYKAYDELAEDEEVDGIIIDLRNNGGGDMNICLNMLDMLIDDDAEPIVDDTDKEEPVSGDDNAQDPENEKEENEENGALLLSVENKYGGSTDYYAADGLGAKVPVVVLVNKNSASASEIFAGALKDYGFDVVGEKTFGKGIVQSVINLKDGSAVKFTTEQYRLPGGGLVQDVGIEPTKEVAFEHSGETKENEVNYVSPGTEPELKGDSQIAAAAEILEEKIYNAYQEQ